jgi:hypothetical protein
MSVARFAARVPQIQGLRSSPVLAKKIASGDNSGNNSCEKAEKLAFFGKIRPTMGYSRKLFLSLDAVEGGSFDCIFSDFSI